MVLNSALEVLDIKVFAQLHITKNAKRAIPSTSYRYEVITWPHFGYSDESEITNDYQAKTGFDVHRPCDFVMTERLAIQ